MIFSGLVYAFAWPAQFAPSGLASETFSVCLPKIADGKHDRILRKPPQTLIIGEAAKSGLEENR